MGAGDRTNRHEATRRELAEKLVELEAGIKPAVADIDAVKDELRAIAIELEEGFREEPLLDGKKWRVSVSRETFEECTGTEPVLNIDAFLDLPKARQEKLVEEGFVRIVRVYKSGAAPRV